MKKICILMILILFIGMSSVSAKPVDAYEDDIDKTPTSIQKSDKVNCGNVTNIPSKIPRITRDVVFIIQIAVPVLLVIFGSIDMVKGIIAGKEDEIKKGQQIFIKRLIAGVLVFFLIVVVKLVISIVDNSLSSSNIINCVDCFLVDEKYCK